MSAGIESTILAVLLIRKYGQANVTAVCGVIEGRRQWECKKAQQMATHLGIRSILVERGFKFMGPQEVAELVKDTSKKYNFDAMFNGAAKLWFNPTFYTSETAKKLQQYKVFLPFIDLQKKHTIYLYEALQVKQLLDHTHSCTNRGDIHCGLCSCCLERHLGFMQLNQMDTTTYNVPFDHIDALCENKKYYNRNW